MSNDRAIAPTGGVVEEPSDTHRPPVGSRVWAIAHAAGLAAACVASPLNEASHHRLAPPEGAMGFAPGTLSAADMERLFRARRDARVFDAMLVFGTLGAVTGLAMGLAGAGARRSTRTARGAALGGFLLGELGGAAATLLFLPIYLAYVDPDKNDLIVGMTYHLAISCVIGAIAGASFGLGLGDRRSLVQGAAGGLLGAATGALFYQIVGAIAFPLDQTSDPISATWSTRLLSRLTVTMFTSVGVALGVLNERR